jgi:hypothetical protein
MPGFHYLVHVRHSQSSRFACPDPVRCAVFMRLLCLTWKGISATASIGKRFEVSISFRIIQQFTILNGRGKKLTEEPRGSCTRFLLLMLHPVTSSCLAAWRSKWRASQRTHSQTFFWDPTDPAGHPKRDPRGCVWRVDHTDRVGNITQRRVLSHRVKEIQYTLKWMSSSRSRTFEPPINCNRKLETI